MKGFNSIDETIDKTSAVNNFLDNLDTDITPPVNSDSIRDGNIDSNDLSNNDFEQNKEEVTALVVAKPNGLFVAQTMFKKSIKISIKSFLISLSLGFLNLFL